MLQRMLVVLGAAALVLVVAAPAVAVRVHVRVEGARATIFGATEPRLTPVTGAITPPAGPVVTVEAETPFGALEAARRAGPFFYRVESFSFGHYVAQIGRRPGTATTGWVYKVNGVSPPVSATAYELEAGDRVLWYYARFGPTGGPKTLDLRGPYFSIADCFDDPCPELSRGPCFDAVALDDNGRRTYPRNVVFRLDGRPIRRRVGTICPDRRWRTLRVTKAGFVRSQVVRSRGRSRTGGGGPALAGRA